MVERKKPTGEEYQQFRRIWECSDHGGKLLVAASWDVTYDTAKHWYSEGDTTPTEPIVTTTLTQAMNVDKLPTLGGLEDLITTEPVINLDFVTFDLETTNLTADFSVILCACIKPFGGEPMVFRADEYNPNWASERSNDEAITRAIAEELAKHAIVVTHYGSKFDIPYLRAKMVKHRIMPLPPMFGIDTYAIAKPSFKVSSRRLENLARYFDLGKKHKVEGGLWVRAGMDGDIDALDEIVAHNILDCELLEKLAALSFPFARSIRKL